MRNWTDPELFTRKANWFCCCSWLQRLPQLVFCEWHFWCIILSNEKEINITKAPPPHHSVIKTAGVHKVRDIWQGTDLQTWSEETLGDPGLTFATPESILKMCSQDAASERNLRTNRPARAGETYRFHFLSPFQISSGRKTLEEKWGKENVLDKNPSLQTPIHIKNQPKEKRTSYLKE